MLATGCLKCLGRCCGVPCGPTEVRPKTARLERKPGICAAYGLDLLSSVLVIINYILTPDTLLSTAIAVVSVILYDLYAVDLSMNMNYSLITFGIIFPLTMSIQQAFTRRETALRSLVMFRSYAISVYSAHRCWDWPANGATVGGREGLPDDHCENVRSLLTDIFKSVEAYCLLPRGGHARYYYTICGHHEFKELEVALTTQTKRVLRGITRLFKATEVMKVHGFPSGEASRLNQFVQKMLTEWELIKAMKEYRTPHAMRCFARFYILGLPAVLAPYYVHVSRDVSEAWSGGSAQGSRLAFACAFAATVSIMMAGLFSVQQSLENPFSPSLDAVRVQGEMADAIEAMDDMNIEAFRDDSVPEPSAPPGRELSTSVRKSTMRVLQLEAPPSESQSATRGVADAV